MCALKSVDPDARVETTGSKSYPIRILSGGWGEPWENRHTQVYATMVSEVLGADGYDVGVVSCQDKRDFYSHMNHEMIAYNCLFGRFGEDGTIAGLLEFLQVSYTGSGPLASALAMDKSRCSAFLAQRDVRTPKTILLERGRSTLDEVEMEEMLRREGLYLSRKTGDSTRQALIVKPNQSSFGSGVTAISKFDELPEALHHAGTYSDSVVVQEFVDGVTICVPVLCGKALTPVEVVPELVDGDLPGFSFRSARKTYLVPARLEADSIVRLRKSAETAHIALGCRGLTRSDFRVTPDGTAYFLELNSQHSIRPNSVALMSARCSGINALRLIESILDDRWIPKESDNSSGSVS